jgi:hypothetical protein
VDTKKLEEDVKNTNNPDGDLSGWQKTAVATQAAASTLIPSALTAHFIHTSRSNYEQHITPVAERFKRDQYKAKNPVFDEALNENTFEAQYRVVPEPVQGQQLLGTNVEYDRHQSGSFTPPKQDKIFEASQAENGMYKAVEKDARFFSWKSLKNSLRPSTIKENAKWAYNKAPVVSSVLAGVVVTNAALDAYNHYHDKKTQNQVDTSESLGRLQEAYTLASPEGKQQLADAVLGKQPIGKFTQKVVAERAANPAAIVHG